MSLPTPYYDQDGITIYCGDCRDILPLLGTVDLVLTDPPYGITEDTARLTRKRTALARCNDFPPIVGDDEPFDPVPLLRFGRVVVFGANHFAHRLPPSPSWIIWDKRADLMSQRAVGFNDGADVEMAWTNLGGPARIYAHRWMGLLKDSERDQRRVHPTQKPIALMRWIIANWTQPANVILDPYMGSAPVLRAAVDLGRRAIGIEISEDYCRIAVKRLRQTVLPLGDA